MSGAAFLADLTAAGIHVTREGEQLRVRAEPGVRLAPYVAHIRQHKPHLLAELLKAEIIAAVTVDPTVFDRSEYERLMALWSVYAADTDRPA